jgi:hypothetical protein
MRKHSTSWPLASLGLALVLGGCGQKESAPTTEGAAPLAGQNPAPTSEPTPATSAATAARMNVSVEEGTLTISLNGRKVGDYQSPLQLDVTPYLKPGQNTITLAWTESTRGSARIQYALAATPDKYNDISSFNLLGSQGKQAGTKSLDFNLPNPDGSLPAVEAATPSDASATAAPESAETTSPSAAPAENAAPAPVAPAETPQKAPSSGVKAIMSVSSNDTPISVSLNGQSVGDFQSYLKIDVGRYLKPGKNQLQVNWKQKTYFDVKIAYFSSDANDYRDVSRTRLYQSDTIKPGSRSISFQIPTS